MESALQHQVGVAEQVEVTLTYASASDSSVTCPKRDEY